MDIRKLTAIGRPVDPEYPTNKAIAIITVVVIAGGIAYKLIAGDAFWHSLGWGFGTGLSVFLSWAVCREIDPDHDLSAFVAAGLTLVGVFFFYPPTFFGVFWLLQMLRIVNRTTGLKPLLQDSIILSLLAAWFTFQGYWIYGLITTIAFLLDSLMPSGERKQLYFALVNALILAVVWVIKGFPATFANFPVVFPLIPVLVIVLFIPLVVSYRVVRSKADVTGRLLDSTRIITAQILALFAGIQLIIQSGYAPMLPLYGAIAGSALYYYFTLITGAGRKEEPTGDQS